MSNFKIFLKSFVLLALVTTFFACGDDDVVTPTPDPDPMNIVDIAAGDAQFSTLVSALQRVNLDDVLTGDGPFTVFAPTNTAFENLGVDLDALSDAELTDILLYHVLGAKVNAADIADGQTYVTTASTSGPDGNAVSMLIEKDGDVVLNNSATVTTSDVEASNGVIHIIDGVVTPLNIVGHAIANSNFTELVAAVLAADGDLATVLQGDGPFTVFAPLNSAFEAIADVTATLTPAELAGVLTYHVAAGNVKSTDLSDGMMVTTVNGGTFTVNINDDGVTLTDAGGNNSTVVLTDVQATNGIVHVLSAVILP